MASLSKREQARNERELHDLLRQPGNSVCADCSARNPAWASWNLGIFLCMRCASIHRKLGTHISKVKSLSMDKWTSDQVESMRTIGNINSNKLYNPKNKKPDIPLDADEVDSAMERFIRKKYQEKSLVDGRPEPPSRGDVTPAQAQAPQLSPTSELPPTGKKHKLFGFSLRTSSKKDRASAAEAFKVTPVEYSPTSGSIREIPDRELQEKLAQLRDMGFSDNERNVTVLKRTGGDLERSIATLVKAGPSEPSRQTTTSTKPAEQSKTTSIATFPAATTSYSNNPFEQEQGSSSFGLSFDEPQQQQSRAQPASPNTNPWQTAMPQQQNTGIEQQLSSLQVSNPLFPNTTGGYGTVPPTQQDPHVQAMTPSIPTINQQYSYSGQSGSNMLNPFHPPPLSSQSTGSNPFIQQTQTQPSFMAQTNPFLSVQQPQNQNVTLQASNPFGFVPSQPSPTAPHFQLNSQPSSTNPFGLPQQQSPPPIQQSQTFPLTQSNSFYNQPSPQFPNFQYGQAQQAPQPQQSPMPQFQPQQTQPALYQSQQPYQTQQFQTLQPQQTGRYTRTDIMALFGHPAPQQQQQQQQSLASIPEPPTETGQAQPQYLPQQQQQQQTLSPAPSNNPYGAFNAASAKRSATMPATTYSSMHSSGGGGSRNPFLSNASSRQVSGASSQFGVPPQPQVSQFGNQGGYLQQGVRHVSNESVSVNNPSLMDGRHSPDAFASLSSTYMR